MPTKITKLTDIERGQFDSWADKWIPIGLRTEPADRAKFEAAVEQCYRFAGIEWPGVVVWVPSPLVLSLAAPTAALAIEMIEAPRRKRAVHRANAMDGAVRDAVQRAVSGAVGDAVSDAVSDVISRTWNNYVGGQFWAGGWGWYGAAFTSFFREVCNLELKGDLWERGQAYEATVESACWWWPHRRFVMVCERPLEIHRELTDPSRERGWTSHQLHREDGPAVVWPDGWGVYSLHGVRVPAWVVETPAQDLDPGCLLKEDNVEVRRELVRKIGIERVCEALNATCIDRQGEYELLLLDLQDGGHRPYLKMRNASIGVWHVEGVHPDCTTVQEALNWRAYGDRLCIWQPNELT